MNRRNNLQLMAPAEKAIYDVMQLVEEMGADVKLTDAIVKLGEAKDHISDYLDELEQSS